MGSQRRSKWGQAPIVRNMWNLAERRYELTPSHLTSFQKQGILYISPDLVFRRNPQLLLSIGVCYGDMDRDKKRER